jgi:hypothetical protein
MERYSTFLDEVVAAPLVVVALEKVHFHSHVGQFAYFAKKACVSFRHDIGVFKPEVEHVAEHIDGFCLVLYGVKEVDETALMGASVVYGP